MIKTFPCYSVWKDYDRNIFEVVRWDSAKTFEVVQTNIPLRSKAYQVMFDWQKRARAQELKNG